MDHLPVNSWRYASILGLLYDNKLGFTGEPRMASLRDILESYLEADSGKKNNSKGTATWLNTLIAAGSTRPLAPTFSLSTRNSQMNLNSTVHRKN